jgi:Co/Zn/Cd efflux system component
LRVHQATVKNLTHTHVRTADYSANESRTLIVVLLTTLTMVIEILAGYWTGSMALLADGWHSITISYLIAISENWLHIPN